MRSRAEWEAFAREHDCCLEPVLELDEALYSELVERARDGRRDRAAGRGAACAPARDPGQAGAHPGRARRLPGPALGEHTEEVLLRRGYSEAEVAELLTSGAAAGRPRGRTSWRPARARLRTSAGGDGAAAAQLLKISELAERSGVSAGTISHYLREGLLGGGEEVVGRAATWPTTRPSWWSGSS